MTTSSAILIAVVCILILLLIFLIIALVRRNARSTGSAEYINEQVYVGNLPYRVSEDDLLEYFSRFGNAQSVRIIRNHKTGRSKGFAFVTYGSPEEANTALEAHGKEMQGRTMVVRIAKPRKM